MSIREKAIQHAIKLIKGAGADFCIKFEGEVYGNLKPMTEEFKMRKPKESYKEIYSEKVHSLARGESCVFKISLTKAENFRSAITGTCSKLWGPKSYITAVTKLSVDMAEVEILRL